MDIMFALPGQTIDEIRYDLDKAILAADQITAYPLFTFPYSAIGQYRKLKKLAMPSIATRKKMFYFIYDYLLDNGYQRVSVWSFKKTQETPRYSSVTREQYIGFGPSADSYYGSLFTLNTFSTDEYINSIHQQNHSVALEMPFTPTLSILYDFYWRLYDTYIPKKREINNLTYDITKVGKIKLLLHAAKAGGMIEENDTMFRLTRKGTFWLHLIQNHFFLRYVNTIWSAAMRRAWPVSIRF